MRRLVALGLMAVMAGPAAAAPSPTKLKIARSSPEDMTRFAVAQVCLPIIAKGVGLETAVAGSAFPWKAVPGAFALYGTTVNYVRINPRGGCDFRIDHGNPDRLRVAVIEALAAAGAATVTKNSFDSGPDGHDSSGKFRQEHYCLAGSGTGGKGLGVEISSGPGVGPKLQVTLSEDTVGPCRSAAP